MPLGKSASASDWIHDFVHSDNPRFAGKSKKERINMALGAYYGKRAEGGDVDEDRDRGSPEPLPPPVEAAQLVRVSPALPNYINTLERMAAMQRQRFSLPPVRRRYARGGDIRKLQTGGSSWMGAAGAGLGPSGPTFVPQNPTSVWGSQSVPSWWSTLNTPGTGMGGYPNMTDPNIMAAYNAMQAWQALPMNQQLQYMASPTSTSYMWNPYQQRWAEGMPVDSPNWPQWGPASPIPAPPGYTGNDPTRGGTGGSYNGQFYSNPYTSTGQSTIPFKPTGPSALLPGYTIGPNGTVIGPDGSIIPAATTGGSAPTSVPSADPTRGGTGGTYNGQFYANPYTGPFNATGASPFPVDPKAQTALLGGGTPTIQQVGYNSTAPANGTVYQLPNGNLWAGGNNPITPPTVFGDFGQTSLPTSGVGYSPGYTPGMAMPSSYTPGGPGPPTSITYGSGPPVYLPSTFDYSTATPGGSHLGADKRGGIVRKRQGGGGVWGGAGSNATTPSWTGEPPYPGLPPMRRRGGGVPRLQTGGSWGAGSWGGGGNPLFGGGTSGWGGGSTGGWGGGGGDGAWSMGNTGAQSPTTAGGGYGGWFPGTGANTTFPYGVQNNVSNNWRNSAMEAAFPSAYTPYTPTLPDWGQGPGVYPWASAYPAIQQAYGQWAPPPESSMNEFLIPGQTYQAAVNALSQAPHVSWPNIPDPISVAGTLPNTFNSLLAAAPQIGGGAGGDWSPAGFDAALAAFNRAGQQDNRGALDALYQLSQNPTYFTQANTNAPYYYGPAGTPVAGGHVGPDGRVVMDNPQPQVYQTNADMIRYLTTGSLAGEPTGVPGVADSFRYGQNGGTSFAQAMMDQYGNHWYLDELARLQGLPGTDRYVSLEDLNAANKAGGTGTTGGGTSTTGGGTGIGGIYGGTPESASPGSIPLPSYAALPRPSAPPPMPPPPPSFMPPPPPMGGGGGGGAGMPAGGGGGGAGGAGTPAVNPYANVLGTPQNPLPYQTFAPSSLTPPPGTAAGVSLASALQNGAFGSPASAWQQLYAINPYLAAAYANEGGAFGSGLGSTGVNTTGPFITSAGAGPGTIFAPGGNVYNPPGSPGSTPVPSTYTGTGLPPGVTLANAAAAASGSSGGWYGGTYYADPYTATGGTTTAPPASPNLLPAGYSIGPNGTVIAPDGSVIPAAHG